METLIRRHLVWLGFLLGLLLPLDQVWAAAYNIILKTGTTPLSCATGGFQFTKTTPGTFDTTGAQVVLNLAGTGNCITLVPDATYNPGNLDVVVQNITLNNQNQGPNVVGLTGTLQFATTAPGTCLGTGATTVSKTYTITFSAVGNPPTPANRTYSITCAGPGGPAFTPVTGQYDVFNTANSVPEPETLLLSLAALTGMGLVSVMSRKRRS